MKPLIPNRYVLNNMTAIILQEWLWHKITQEVWYAVKPGTIPYYVVSYWQNVSAAKLEFPYASYQMIITAYDDTVTFTVLMATFLDSAQEHGFSDSFLGVVPNKL